MDKLILTLHISACVLLIVFVLLQSGKEGMGVIFGGGSSSLFGGSGAGGILVKLTTFVAIIFFSTSLGYSIVTSKASNPTESLIKQTYFEDMPGFVRPDTAPTQQPESQSDAINNAISGEAAIPSVGASSEVVATQTPVVEEVVVEEVPAN